MLISCIIPAYETKREYLIESLDSVFVQDYPSIELIITDDASKNFDSSTIEKYIENHKKGNIVRYQVLHHKTNLGTVGNLNKAIESSKGDIIMLLSSDDRFHDNSVISRIVNRFNQSKCDVLACSRMKCTEDLKKELRLMPHPSYVPYINSKLNTPDQQFRLFALQRSFEFASGAAMYFRRSFIERYGGFDSRYVLWEDGPFIARTTRDGTYIQTAYDIISIDYRSGGISSAKSKKKKTTAQSLIANDYVNMIKYELIPYFDRFSTLEKQIIMGNLERRQNEDRYNIKIVLKYPASFVNYVFIKCQKAILRIRQSDDHNG